MIDEEGTLILTNKTKIPDDIHDKIKKIVIDSSFKGIWTGNIFENYYLFRISCFVLRIYLLSMFKLYYISIFYYVFFSFCAKFALLAGFWVASAV